jgi:beta-glucosidase
MKKILPLIIIMSLVSCMENTQETVLADGPVAKKVDSLLSIMTVEEKIGQLNLYNGTWEFTGPVPDDNNSKVTAENIKNGLVGGMLNVLTAEGIREAQKLAVENSRLGIPLIFGYDVVHGYKTMLPIPLAQAASWDSEVARMGSRIAAKEAASAGLNWTFAPMIDISRDARWGRIMEGPGEDPYLASIMAKAWVEGFQGDDLKSVETIAACAKHFAAYGLAEAGREYNTVEISNNTMYNTALPPFKAANDAGVATFMNAFNDINGIPATAHKQLQRDLLKGSWKFEGFVVSDWASISELISHGYAQDSAEAASMAMNAGSDMDMASKVYERHLKKQIELGNVQMSDLDDAVRRILTVKFKLGLFDDPYRYCNSEREKNTLLSADHLAGSRDAARKSIVLLKNEKILPLSKAAKSIAVIGQLAESKDVPLGSWRAQAVKNSAVSILEGIQNAVSNSTKVTYSQGYTLTEGDRSFIYELNIVEGNESLFPEAIKAAKSSEIVVLVIGEDCFQSGEGRSQADITLKSNQEDLFHELLKVNKNLVVVLTNGRPLAIPEVIRKAPAIIEIWYGGSEGGNAAADVLFGDYNPTGRLPVSFPYHVGQEPLYYARKNTGRFTTNDFDDGLVFWSHYTDVPNDAILPFGFGLSYSTFEYGEMNVEVISDGKVKVQTSVKNTSEKAGSEVVQVYIRDIAATLVQPIKRLVSFQRVQLAPGEEKVVSFELTENDLGYYHADGTFSADDGVFNIMVGPNSEDLKMKRINIKF